MHRARLLSLLALVAALSLVFVACGGDDDDDTPEGSPTPEYYGPQVAPVPEKPDIVLTDTSGDPFDLRKETDGYLTLVYLGYTHCPDACPTHMSDIANALDELDDDVTEKVKVVFITTDPERDTPEELRRWLDVFDESFIGLTGDPETIEQLQIQLNMNPAEKVDIGDGNYLVNHASYVLAFTAEDNLSHTVYPLGVSREAWVHDIEKLATEGWTGS